MTASSVVFIYILFCFIVLMSCMLCSFYRTYVRTYPDGTYYSSYNIFITFPLFIQYSKFVINREISFDSFFFLLYVYRKFICFIACPEYEGKKW